MKKFLVVLMLAVIASAAFSQTGVVREITGEVGLKYAGSANFVAARAGSTVSEDTIISTGLRSTAVITIGSSTITVRPLTRLSVAELSSQDNTENLNVNLQTGRVRIDVKPPAGTRASTSVQTPSATASVRGTSFEMDSRSIRTSEGTVSYAGKNGLPVMVAVGSASELSEDGESALDPIQLAGEGFADVSRVRSVLFPGSFGIQLVK